MIRKYKEAEIPLLVSIWEEASAKAHPFLSPEFTAMVKKAMSEMYLPKSNTWVYEKDRKAIGFISMLGNEIGGLFLLPDNQAKGIGTQLLNHVKKQHEVLEVEVFDKNKIGKPFYLKHGFKEIKTYILEGTNQKVLRMGLSKDV